jgi:hypothetical protein
VPRLWRVEKRAARSEETQQDLMLLADEAEADEKQEPELFFDGSGT